MTSVRMMDLAARLLLAAALLTLLAAGLLWLAQRPAFDIRRIDVRGDLQHVSGAAVRAAVAGQLHGNFFTMRLDEARRSFETTPWVARASVRRVWPDRLLVTLTEHRALGVWGDGRLLSDAGVLFTANPAEAEVYGPLAQLDAPEALAAEVARRYYEFSAALAPLSLQVAAVDVSERASWRLRAAAGERPGPVIELGRDEPVGRLSDRIQQIAATWPQVVARLNSPPARIDMRYATGFAAASAARTSKP